MDDTTKTQEFFSQMATKGIETMTVWAEVNQRVLRELVELSAGSAKEGVRLYSEVSRSVIDAARESQAAALRWQAGWVEASKDPSAWCQKALTEGMNGAQQTFRRVEEHTQAITRSAERLQASAEQAGKGIQESLAGAVSKMKEIYATT